eukprot:780712-Amphidinium_carterae.1
MQSQLASTASFHNALACSKLRFIPICHEQPACGGVKCHVSDTAHAPSRMCQLLIEVSSRSSHVYVDYSVLPE